MANLSKIYSDLDLTFKKTPGSKDVALSYDNQAVIRSVRNLLSTAFYERLFQPDIGSNVNTILFEPIEEINASILENEILVTLRNYEPRVTVNTIDVSVLPDDNSYSATISFFIGNNTAPTTVNLLLQRLR
jgi:phage baseplate assembly protein W